MIEQYVHWNEDIGEWQLKCVAYTGNNMRKQTPQPDKDKDKVNMSSELAALQSWCRFFAFFTHITFIVLHFPFNVLF